VIAEHKKQANTTLGARKRKENSQMKRSGTLDRILKAIALAMQQAGTTESKKVVEAMEKIKFDGGKGRELYFRPWDRQLMQPMWVAVGKKKGEEKDQWDIWKIAGEVPDKNESLEVIAATKEDNPCEFKRP